MVNWNSIKLWRRRRSRLTRVESGLLAVAGVMVCIALAIPAQADFSSSHYSFNSSNCSTRVDPIGVVFYGYGAYAGSYGHSRRTFDLLNGMPGWGDTSGGDQWASSHGVCTKMESEIATGCGSCTRYHIRLNQTHHQDTKGRFETVGTPHYEIKRDCGHAVPPDNPSTSNPDSGFDLGRGHVKADYLRSYGSAKLGDTQNWGNTATMRQCDGRYAGSSGRVYWLKTD
jgi:hypothetical protein